MTDKTLRTVLVRTFFLQSTWNFERMQNLGFCYAILPALRKIYKKEGELKEPLRRHLEFFNTHPYLASAIIGVVVRMEEDVESGLVGADDVNTLKTAVMGSCGAIGDSFFWGALKPLVSIVAVLLAALGFILAPIIFLLLYNLPHVWIKIFGFYAGYSEGVQVFDRFKSLNFPALAIKAKFLGVILSGALLAVLFHNSPAFFLSGGTMLTVASMLILFLVCYGLIKKGTSIQTIIYILLVLSVGSSTLM